MCEDGVGVDTDAAEHGGLEAIALAERYATISADFRTELSILSEASAEMPVVTGALDYVADVVGQLLQLQVHTDALGASSTSGAAAGRRADVEIGSGLGTVFAT